MSGQRVGYIRVSSMDQYLGRQLVRCDAWPGVYGQGIGQRYGPPPEGIN